MQSSAPGRRIGLVLSGGGARGAYEVGVLAHLFEHVLPALPELDFAVVSGTSVGAIHAAYTIATAHWEGPQRARRLAEIWRNMELGQVVRIGVSDLVGVPLRALGLSQLRRRAGGKARAPEVIGGLVDVSPLERIVAERIPWSALRENLAGARPRALCVLCTEVRSGHVAVFLDGALADPTPWASDPNIVAIPTEITAQHVRASAAIPFLFPAVRIGDCYYVDGGLRMNTPLSPALRLGCDRLLVVALKHRPAGNAAALAFSEDVISQPAFLIGKVLDALILDQLEVELHRLHVVNALLAQGSAVYGEGFVESVSGSVRAERGAGYRIVDTAVVRPSEDIGRIAAHTYARHGARALGTLPSLLTRIALRGVPRDEADLLSYLFFDRRFTGELVALGREDARRNEEEIVKLLTA